MLSDSNDIALHKFIQKRASFIYASLSNNKLYQQLQATQLPKLQHIFHSKPYHYTLTYDTLRTKTPSLSVAAFIDHTLLAPTTTKQHIVTLCNESRQYQFYSVCINSSYTSLCKELLYDSSIHITTVVGFPLGQMCTSMKRGEAEYAVNVGSNEIDMVIHIGKLIEGDYGYVLQDINEVVRATAGRTVKVILETCLLSDEQIIDGCILSVLAGATFVKTSTGFSKHGATVHHVRLMRTVVGDACHVKASGGIRDFQTAIQMINAGATRLGCSASVAIVEDEKQAQIKEGADDGTNDAPVQQQQQSSSSLSGANASQY